MRRARAPRSAAALAAAALLAGAAAARPGAHAAAVMAPADSLPKLGAAWRETNPYRETPAATLAVRVGRAGYDNNCARCHGINVISGGLVPDLRKLALGEEGDALYAQRVRNGVVRNGITYMPRMAEQVSQEQLWAIRTYLETRHVDE